jgi:small-conductance mechanosensitive channel
MNEQLTNIRGQVLLALWDTFKANGVQIPFPHREIIVRSPVRVESAPRPDPP